MTVHFLVDASLPRCVAGLIRSHGHSATDVRDIGLGTASDSRIAAHAKENQLVLISVDGDFGNNKDYPPADYAGLVIVQSPPDANRAMVLRLVGELLNATAVLAVLPGRLAIVEIGRIRLRPPMSS